jgi:hypothetical protein
VYSVAVTGGEPAALTNSTTDTTIAVSYFPKDDRFLYTRDKGGEREEPPLRPGEGRSPRRT